MKLEDTDAGTLRAINAMRDDEQHWFNIVSEQIFYLHARAGVTLFDELLDRVFGEHLADRLTAGRPERDPHRPWPALGAKLMVRLDSVA